MGVKVTMKDVNTMLAERNLGIGKEGQRYVDSEVIRLSHQYIPFDTGMLASSAIRHTELGSGDVVWNTPYAKKQYYTHSSSQGRGRLWFERMKAQHKKQIATGLGKIVGGKVD